MTNENNNGQAPGAEAPAEGEVIVQEAPEQAQEQGLAPCPCGATPQNLIIEMPQRAKYGRASGDCCGEWGIEFRNGYTDDPQLTQERAVKAWTEAPRAA